MPLYAHMAFMDVRARHRAQVLIAGVLIQTLPHLRPADLIIKLANLLFGVLHAYLPFPSRRGAGGEVHVNGSPTKNLKVSPNCAMPSSLNTFSTGHTSKSSQKFIRRHGKGRGYSKKKR